MNTNDTSKLKRLTLGEAAADTNHSLYLLNNTVPRGKINIAISLSTGDRPIIVIPASWIPFDITTQIDKMAFLQSPEVRRVIASKNLVIVSSEDAENFFKNSDLASKEAVKVYSAAQESSVMVNSSPEVLREKEQENVSLMALTWVELTEKEDPIDEDSLYSMILGNQSVLTKEDFAFLAKNIKYQKVQEFCAERA